jgi:hypothetical protein
VRLELHPEARAELRSAALWYEERHSGLGDEFIAEVSAALDRIGDAPESYAHEPLCEPMLMKPTQTLELQHPQHDAVPTGAGLGPLSPSR